LFPRLKKVLKGTRFDSVAAIKGATTRAPKDIPVQAFQEANQAWQNRWKKCIAAQGSYFEVFRVYLIAGSLKVVPRKKIALLLGHTLYALSIFVRIFMRKSMNMTIIILTCANN